MIFAAECAEIVDIPGICGYNVSVILDKYALVETQVLCNDRETLSTERSCHHG